MKALLVEAAEHPQDKPDVSCIAAMPPIEFRTQW